MPGILNMINPPTLISLAIGAPLLYMLFRHNFLLEWTVFYYNKLRHRTSLTRQEYLRIHRFLQPRVHYYRKMTNRGKARFINRVLEVMETKRFIGKEGFEVTDEVKTIVSAAIAQLTFGLDKYFLKHYTRIFIYPEAFYSPVLKSKLKGGVTPKGSIILSWKDTVKGFEENDSKMNVALHEMAHALKLEALEGADFDRKFMIYLYRWLKIADSEYQSLHVGNSSFLRKYGGTNKHEFFAVCVEYFFEAPREFSESLPDIYNHMCFLLNQNPTNVKGNYALTKDFKEEINQDESLIPLPRWVIKRKRRKWKKRYRWVKRKQHLPEKPIAAQTVDDQP